MPIQEVGWVAEQLGEQVGMVTGEVLQQEEVVVMRWVGVVAG